MKGQGRGDEQGFETLTVIQGVICVVFGALLFALPAAALSAVVVMLGAYWLLRGGLTLVQAVMVPAQWLLRGLVVVLSVVAGALVLQAPLLGLFAIGPAILVFLGLQALVAGVAETFLGAQERHGGVAMLGVVNIVFGALLLTTPAVDVTLLPPTLGAVALLAGVLSLYLTVRSSVEPSYANPRA